MRVHLGVQVSGGQGFLDAVLTGCKPVHRRVDLIGAGTGQPQVGAQGGVGPPPAGRQFRTGPDHPGHDQAQGKVAVAPGRAQQFGQAQRPGLGHHRGDMTVRSRAQDGHVLPADQHRFAGQHRPQHLQCRVGQCRVGQRRQVRQGLVLDLALVAVGTAQQVRHVHLLPPSRALLRQTAHERPHRRCACGAQAGGQGRRSTGWLSTRCLARPLTQEVSSRQTFVPSALMVVAGPVAQTMVKGFPFVDVK